MVREQREANMDGNDLPLADLHGYPDLVGTASGIACRYCSKEVEGPLLVGCDCPEANQSRARRIANREPVKVVSNLGYFTRTCGECDAVETGELPEPWEALLTMDEHNKGCSYRTPDPLSV